MNRIEKALMHALFVHLHHNIDKAIDFKEVFEYKGKTVAVIPNRPTQAQLAELFKG